MSQQKEKFFSWAVKKEQAKIYMFVFLKNPTCRPGRLLEKTIPKRAQTVTGGQSSGTVVLGVPVQMLRFESTNKLFADLHLITK